MRFIRSVFWKITSTHGCDNKGDAIETEGNTPTISDALSTKWGIHIRRFNAPDSHPTYEVYPDLWQLAKLIENLTIERRLDINKAKCDIRWINCNSGPWSPTGGCHGIRHSQKMSCRACLCDGAYVPILVHQHGIGRTDHLSSACFREFLQM